MDEVEMQKMIEPVAKQMCILAGLNPEHFVYVPASRIRTRAEDMFVVRERYPSREVWGIPLNFSASEAAMGKVAMEKVRMPSYSCESDTDINAPMWKCFRGAAYDAILGYFAVKQVLMVGKEIPR